MLGVAYSDGVAGLSKCGKSTNYIQGGKKKRPILFWPSKLRFTIFFLVFQVGLRESSGDFSNTKMDIIKRIITQHRVKFKDAYFASK